MAHDQVHEQLNAMVKGDGGVIGITENDDTLRRWSVAGPETTRVLAEYSEGRSKEPNIEGNHHERIPSIQKKMCRQRPETLQ